MGLKAEKKARKRAKALAAELAPTGEIEAPFKPKAGPDQTFVRELIGMQTGHAKRYRNVSQSALMLAYHRGQLATPNNSKITTRINAEDRLMAGEKFQGWFHIRASSGRDSMDFGVGGSSGLFWHEARQRASDSLCRVRDAMSAANYLIVERFCGENQPMAVALRGIVDVHPDGTAYRMREALDELVAVVTGQRFLPTDHVAVQKNISSLPLDRKVHPFS